MCGIYISLGALLINPMLRVRYSDEDYSNVDEIDQILTKPSTYQNASIPNPNAVLNQTYQNSIATGQQTQYTPPNVTPQPVQQVPVETVATPQVPTEKVVNPNFKQEDIPEAIIPSLNFEEPVVESTPAPVETAPVVEPTQTPVEAAPVVEPTQTPVETAPVVEPTPAPVETAPVAEPTPAPVEAAPVAEPTPTPAVDTTQPNT